jgi:hypothetical protein
MKHPTKISFWLFMVIPYLFQCKKLPNETHEGKDTFGFLVNGKKFISAGLNGQELICSYQKSLKQLRVQGNKRNTQNGIYINYSDIELGLGKFDITTLNWADYTEDGVTYHCYKGFLELTFLDTLSSPHILSGRFEFDAKNQNDEKNITKGRFDLVLSLYQ